MRMTSPGIVVPFLAVMVVFGITRAKAEDPPPEVDAARQSERYVIQPGAEPLFAEMLGQGETLPGGCTLSDGKIERTSVLATYTCGDAQIVLHLIHPASAPVGAVGTQRLAVTVASGTPPAGLVEAVADRIRVHGSAFEWTEVGMRSSPARRWPFAVGAVVAMLAFWAWRRRAARRKRSD